MDPRDQKSDESTEREFEKDLEQARSIWSGLEQAEPPDLVDQAVLIRARRELIAHSRRRSLRWLGAFATASVVVLALTIVVQQDRELAAPSPPSKDGFRVEKLKKQEQEQEAKRDARIAVDAPAGESADTSVESRLDEDLDDRQAGSRGNFREMQAAPVAAPDLGESRAGEAFAVSEAEEVAADSQEGQSTQPEAEEWVERLLLLHRSELYEKLEVELEAFRKAYPDYPLPPELAN